VTISTRKLRGGNHTFLYLLLGLLALLPVALFVIGPLSGDSFSVRGPAGPAVAFSAGLLSFLSPCVLPLVPVYITHLSGATFEHGRLVANRRATFTHSLVFVSGFSAVFILFGVSVGLLGSYFITDHQRDFEQVAGVVLMVMGILLVPAYGKRSPARSVILLAAVVVVFVALADLANLRGQSMRLGILGLLMALAWLRFSGYVEIPIFQRTFQVDLARSTGAGYGRSLLVGGSFALGWTPCIGPVLASILTLAERSSSAWSGLYLLSFYSAGLSVPFLLTGLALSDATRILRRIQRFAPAIEVTSAIMIISLGVLLWSGRLTALNQYFDFGAFGEGL
jgi:cytochrome c-type biogenesis protein